MRFEQFFHHRDMAITLAVCLVAACVGAWYRQRRQERLERLEAHQQQRDQWLHLSTQLQNLQEEQQRHQQAFETRVRDTMSHQQREWLDHWHRHTEQHQHHAQQSQEQLQTHLQRLHQGLTHQVDQNLQKTSATLQTMIERLTRIDAAQQQLDRLSGHIVDLQQLLSDKKSRGAWGEAQLHALLKNALPPQHVVLQHTFSNGKRVDALLKLPPPTGDIPIDAKFPLEDYRTWQTSEPGSQAAKAAKQRFQQAVRHHIQAIASRYILPPETAPGAMMFIPAEAVFADIHAHCDDCVTLAQQTSVWLVSPSTLMAVLTTASAVIKDVETRRQVHVMQDHLRRLGEDFQRFDKRMDQLGRHLEQAHSDVQQIRTSSKKITRRFHLIDNVELDQITSPSSNASATLTEDA